MECVVCNKPEMEVSRAIDHADYDCDECGKYRVTGTVRRQLDMGRWLKTSAMQEWLAVQHKAGVKLPVINSENVEFEGIITR